MITRIEIYQSRARKTKGQYGWRAIAKNGRIIAVAGELFTKKSHAEKVVKSVLMHGYGPEGTLYGLWFRNWYTGTGRLTVVDLTRKGGAR